MNETNRLLIVLVCAAWIVLMAVVMFIAWAAPDEVIDALGDFVEFLNDNDSTAGKMIVTLAALAAAILALLVIIVELAPEDEPKELRVEQAGATTIVPADALRMRLEEALLTLPEVTAARSRVRSRDKGIAADLELTLTPSSNVASVTQEASRVVIDTIHADLGLPVAGAPSVKIAFGGSRPVPVASSVAASPEPEPPLPMVETVDERMAEPTPDTEGCADTPPGSYSYGQPGSNAEPSGEMNPDESAPN